MERINHEGDKGTVRILTEDTHMNTDILVTNDILRRDLQSDMLLSQDQQRSTPLHDLPMEQPPSNRFRAQHSNSKGYLFIPPSFTRFNSKATERRQEFFLN